MPTRARRDGWTAGRQCNFIAALARTGCVTGAALEAGMSRAAEISAADGMVTVKSCRDET